MRGWGQSDSSPHARPQEGQFFSTLKTPQWLAGGGIIGGTIYGAADDFGFKAVGNPVSVHDLHATMLHLLGYSHERLTYRFAGRDYRLTDLYGKVVKEIIA